MLAVSFMLFQIALLRELRFQLTTLFTLTPFLFSSVIVWIAIGSLCAGRIRSGVRDVLRWSTLVLPLLVLPLFAISISIAHALIADGDVAENARFQAMGMISQSAYDQYFRSTIIAFITVAVVGYGLIFYLQGLIFSLYFRDGREEGTLSSVYGADLIASGLGAILGGLLNFFLTPIQLVIGSTLLFLATAWVSLPLLGIRIRTAAAVTGAVLAMILGGEILTGFLTRLEQPPWLHTVKQAIWSRYRHIDARESGDVLSIYTDGMFFQGYKTTDNKHDRDPRSLSADLIATMDPPARDVLIIGGGSGADVRILRNRIGKELNIVAVELDAGFIRMAQCFPWLWDTYSTARIVVQEGRYFLENTKELFDMVVMAYVDPQSAVGSIGVPDANFLYTDAGLKAAYARVRPGGFFLISRVYLEQEQESFVRRMCATLESAGIPKGEAAVYRGRGSGANQYFGQISSLHVIVKKGGTPPELERGKIRLPWVSGGRPTTDLFPFSLGTGIWFDSLLSYVRRNAFPVVLASTAFLLIVLAMSTSLSRSVFFTLGFGSFLLESLVLFNSFLLLGDPNLGAALAVGFFLLWNGIGSMLSARFENRNWFYVAVPLIVLLYGVTAPLLNGITITSPVFVRTIIFALHLSLAGVAAGMMFPIALRKFREAPVPWMFFMDVLGCALAPPVFWLAISTVGIWLVMAGATLCYMIVCAVVALRH
jgi:predicted membrane-bound spermidine synthase